MPGSHCLAPCFLLWGHCCQWCEGEHLLFLPSQQGRSIFPLEQRHTLPFFNLWFIEHNWGFFYRLSNQLPRRDGLVTPLSWDQKLILCQVVVFVYFIKENRRGRCNCYFLSDVENIMEADREDRYTMRGCTKCHWIVNGCYVNVTSF